jgi:acetyltransferase-like isoleucine patch superfamily enzyme
MTRYWLRSLHGEAAANMGPDVIVHASPDSPAVVQIAARERSGLFIFLKRCVQAICSVLVFPRLLCCRVGQRLFGARAFGAASESIARIPGLRGVYLRQAFYRHTLARCGRDVYIGWSSAFSMTDAALGERVYIGRFCSIGFADIEDEVMLADHVQILSGGREHGLAPAGQTMHEQPQTFRRVRIGRGAWIGAGAIIMADVGAGAIIGAGAVVTRTVPPRCVAVGVPAGVIRTLETISNGGTSGGPKP